MFIRIEISVRVPCPPIGVQYEYRADWPEANKKMRKIHRTSRCLNESAVADNPAGQAWTQAWETGASRRFLFRPDSARRRLSPGPTGPRAGFATAPGRAERRRSGRGRLGRRASAVIRPSAVPATADPDLRNHWCRSVVFSKRTPDRFLHRTKRDRRRSCAASFVTEKTK
jgi:hypothetical protein